MSAEVISIPEDRPVDAAQDLMKANRIRHLPVVNKDNELAGIVSIKDFGKVRGKNECVKDIMTTPVRVVTKSTNIKSVIEAMLSNKISSLLVANDRNVVGIVTTEDLLKLLSQVLEDKDDLDSFELGSFFDDSWSS
jgi:CBS domain-containing protein